MGFSLKKAFKKVKRAAKKVEKVGKKGFKKVLPKKVYKAASKVVRNPIFQTVALSVATAGIGGMLQASSRGALQKIGGKMLAKTAGKTLAQRGVMSSLIKKSAISAVKKEAGKKIVGRVANKYVQKKQAAAIKKINSQAANYAKAGTVVAASTAAMLPAAQKIAKAGGDIKSQLVKSDAFKTTVTAGTNAAIRPQVIAQLKAQGVPSNQLNNAADAVIDSLSKNAVAQKQSENTLGKVALVGIPLAMALLGG